MNNKKTTLNKVRFGTKYYKAYHIPIVFKKIYNNQEMRIFLDTESHGDYFIFSYYEKYKKNL